MPDTMPFTVIYRCAVHAGPTVDERGFVSVADSVVVAELALIPARVFVDFLERPIARYDGICPVNDAFASLGIEAYPLTVEFIRVFIDRNVKGSRQLWLCQVHIALHLDIVFR
ncbi:hypothetical protein, partial [Endozoicomonas atrinae]|uniref:hypothetical protein n=1 Tax=Endozoicomonas atrinae TaxID=1333660 RepID=UPI001EE6A275